MWHALTGLDLIARWLLPNDFRLEAGHRFAVDSDPIRRWGLRGTAHYEVLAFDEGKMRSAPVPVYHHQHRVRAGGGRTSARRIGEVRTTLDAWCAAI